MFYMIIFLAIQHKSSSMYYASIQKFRPQVPFTSTCPFCPTALLVSGLIKHMCPPCIRASFPLLSHTFHETCTFSRVRPVNLADPQTQLSPPLTCICFRGKTSLANNHFLHASHKASEGFRAQLFPVSTPCCVTNAGTSTVMLCDGECGYRTDL
jgi:hypothetical protein